MILHVEYSISAWLVLAKAASSSFLLMAESYVLNSSHLKQSGVRQLSKAPVVGCPAPAVCVGGGLTWRDHRGEGGRGLCGAGYCKRKELLESANPLLNIT